MEHTIFDLGAIPNDQHFSNAGTGPPHKALFITGTLTLVLVLVIAVLVLLNARPQPQVVQQALLLPTPEPLQPPRLPAPAVTLTMPPTQEIIQIPPPRPSLWEIRAELKRGLGEWEFPHYLNAPHFGSGPDSPLPSMLKPRIATVVAR